MNDDFTNATPLYGNSVIFNGTLANATYEAGESSCSCDVGFCVLGGSVWWSWTAANSTAVVIDTFDRTVVGPAGFAVHTGSNVTMLTDLDCSSMGFPTNRYVCFSATAGTTYYVRAMGTNAGSFALRLTATNAPVILTRPQNRTLSANSSLMLGVVAAGLLPLKYQWQFEGGDLPGETAPTLVLHRLGVNQMGDYSIVVSNVSGVMTSFVANIIISPTNVQPFLAAVYLPDTNRFYFSLTSAAGRKSQIQSTTNLINWSADETVLPFQPSGELGVYGVVLNTNESSVFSIPQDSGQKFIRATPFLRPEICIAQLEAINFAIKLWAIETKHASNASVAETDIIPYLKGVVVCPTARTFFAQSYGVLNVTTPPFCKIVPLTHRLPP